MKRISIISATVLTVIFGFSSCTKNEFKQVKEKGQFVLYTDISKTTNDSLSTKWKANDAISVFHAQAGTTTYGTNDKFAIDEAGLSSGQFFGNLTEELYETNDWYAVYPYNAKMTSPKNPDGWYCHIGCYSSSQNAQSQKGNNSTAHLAGQNFPLYAQAKSVAQGSSVSLTFKPALSIVKFHVTNNSNLPLSVDSLYVSAEQEDIIGSYYIDFSGDTPAFTPSGAQYVAKKAVLKVSGGAAIEVGESADFYLALKPFSNAEGKTLTFAVNGYERNTTSAINFNPGTIKVVNFSYDKAQKVIDYSGTYAVMVKLSDGKFHALSSKAASSSRLTSVEVDYDGTSPSYTVHDATLVWDVAKQAEGLNYTFKNDGKYLSWNSGNTAVMSDTEYLLSLKVNRSVTDSTFTVASVATSTRILARNANVSYEYFAFYEGSGANDLHLVPAILELTPVIQPITDPKTVIAAGQTGVEVKYTVLNPVDGRLASASTTAEWITNFDCSTYGTIKFDVAKNTGAERDATVTVSYEGASDVTFKVTQATASSATWTRVTAVDTLLKGGTFIIGYEATAKSGTIVPMQNTGTATTSAYAYIYSGTADASSGNATINMATVSSTSKYEVTIVASTKVEGAICIKVGGNFIGNEDSKAAKNACKLFASESANTAFTPTVGTNDVFTLKIDGNATYHTLQYNTGSPRFAVYGGTQKNVVIYKKD